MAKVLIPSDLSQINDPQQFMRFCSQFVDDLVQIVNGKIQFDSNFLSQTVTVKFTAANTDQAISHGLNKTQVNYIASNKSKACDVFNGVTANTTNKLYLQCTQAATVTLVLY